MCGTCKGCRARTYRRAYYLRNRERELAQQRAAREADPEAYAERHRKWRAGRREVMREQARARYAKDPQKVLDRQRERLLDPTEKAKHQARVAVWHAVNAGRLVRQPCEACGAVDVHAHHEDYDRPLDVRWLCPVHHAEVHRAVTS